MRPLTEAEMSSLEQIARANSDTADRVTRARILLAVAGGASFTTAARLAGRQSGDAVAHLVARFNEQGLRALTRRHNGGAPVEYGQKERERILQEARRDPDPEQDGTATWSLATLQRALRKAPDGLPKVSTWTILKTLREAGVSWQGSRAAARKGTAQRKP